MALTREDVFFRLNQAGKLFQHRLASVWHPVDVFHQPQPSLTGTSTMLWERPGLDSTDWTVSCAVGPAASVWGRKGRYGWEVTPQHKLRRPHSLCVACPSGRRYLTEGGVVPEARDGSEGRVESLRKAFTKGRTFSSATAIVWKVFCFPLWISLNSLRARGAVAHGQHANTPQCGTNFQSYKISELLGQ